jgi:hypothetical protein
MSLKVPDYGFLKKRPWINGDIRVNLQYFGYMEFVSDESWFYDIGSANQTAAGSGKTKLT